MAAESFEGIMAEEVVANADLVKALNAIDDIMHRIDSLNDPDM